MQGTGLGKSKARSFHQASPTSCGLPEHSRTAACRGTQQECGFRYTITILMKRLKPR